MSDKPGLLIRLWQRFLSGDGQPMNSETSEMTALRVILDAMPLDMRQQFMLDVNGIRAANRTPPAQQGEGTHLARKIATIRQARLAIDDPTLQALFKRLEDMSDPEFNPLFLDYVPALHHIVQDRNGRNVLEYKQDRSQRPPLVPPAPKEPISQWIQETFPDMPEMQRQRTKMEEEGATPEEVLGYTDGKMQKMISQRQEVRKSTGEGAPPQKG